MSHSDTSAVDDARHASAPVTLPVSITAYQPGTPLDAELADLGYAAMCGWPDQRPVTAALVRSQLRPFEGSPPTLMFLTRTAGGGLVAADAAALGRLYHAVHPTHELVVAAGTYRWWSADERFVADGLVGVAGPDGELQAAALMYPLIHADPRELAEALVAEVLVHPGADRAALARPLIAVVLAAGARHDARVARAVVPTTERALLADLHAAGLTTVEEVRCYQAPLALRFSP